MSKLVAFASIQGDYNADETVGTNEDEILPFLKEKKHPALDLDPIMGGEDKYPGGNVE